MTEHIVQLIAPIYSAICAAFPEFNVIALLGIGRLSYESRLSIIYPVSLNHINLLILVIHILWFGRRQKFKSVIIPTLKIFLLFCAWLTVSSILFSNYPDYALEKLIGIAVLPILSIYLMKIRILQIGNSSIQKLLVSLIVVTTILGGLGCVMWVRDPGLYRLAVLGGGPIGLGRMTGMGLIVLVMILLTPESVTTWGRNIIIVMITILLTALLLTLTKGPMASLTICLLIIHRIVKNTWRPRWHIIVAILLTVVVSVGMDYFRQLGYPDTNVWYGSYIIRLEHFSHAVNAFIHHPILGIGWGNFRDWGNGWLYPHNLIMEVLSETGIVGLTLLTWILVPFFCGFLSHTDRYSILFRILALFMILNQMVSGDMIGGRFLWFFHYLYMIHDSNSENLNQPISK